MPELPEVEIQARYLQERLPGRQVRSVQVGRGRIIRPHTPADLEAALAGRRFQRISRRAKHLLFELEARPGQDPLPAVGHLGMTGRMYLQEPDAPLPRHAAVVLELDRGRFVFEDPRGFGRFHLDPGVLEGLGPEPLSGDFTGESLARALAGSRQPIKVRLLDQAVVAGVGNIYASEALFRAGLSPRRAAGRLSRAQATRLQAALREVLAEAIEAGSTLPLDFAGGTDGLFYYGTSPDAPDTYEERLQVYGRRGQPCLRCGTPIRQAVQAGRSTFWCPRCQRG